MSEPEWTLVEKDGRGRRFPDPVFSVMKHDRIGLLAELYKEMGRPTAVKVYSDGQRLAFEPADRGDRALTNVYLTQPLNNDDSGRATSAQINTSKLIDKADLDPGKKYRAEYDDETGYWILDPSQVYG